MNLDRLIFVPRIRKHWESVDLAWRLVATFWRPMFISLFCLSFPIFLILSFLEPLSAYATMIIWWLKPLFERTQLYVLSLGIFGNLPSWKETLKSAPSYVFRQLLPALLWRRLSPTRSFDLSVSQLEGLAGEKRTKRLKVLHNKVANTATWLTIILVHIESIILFSLFLLLMMFMPPSLDLSFEAAWSEHVWLVNVLYYVSVLLVAPYYIASGFMLYINRRVELEGWDIELKFKEIAESRQARAEKSVSGGALKSIAAFLLMVTFATLAPQDITYAQEQSSELESLVSCEGEQCDYLDRIDEAQSDITKVLEDEAFHRLETVKIPRWLDEWKFDDEEADSSDYEMSPFMRSVLQFLSSSIELIIWGVFLSILVFLIVRYRALISRFVLRSAGRGTAPIEVPEVMFGLDVREDRLPDDIESEAQRFIAAGQYRECLSLLYRAIIARLLHQHRVPFRASNTELECLAISKTRVNEEVYTYFAGLTRAWRKLAYGHITPTEDSLRVLCRGCFEILSQSSVSSSHGSVSELNSSETNTSTTVAKRGDGRDEK